MAQCGQVGYEYVGLSLYSIHYLIISSLFLTVTGDKVVSIDLSLKLEDDFDADLNDENTIAFKELKKLLEREVGERVIHILKI